MNFEVDWVPAPGVEKLTDAANRITLQQIAPGVIDNVFKASPLLDHINREMYATTDLTWTTTGGSFE